MKLKQKDVMALMNKYKLPVPMILYPGLSEASIKAASRACRAELTAASSVYRELDVYRLRIIRKYASNNWLKMHGYPMRRKARN